MTLLSDLGAGRSMIVVAPVAAIRQFLMLPAFGLRRIRAFRLRTRCERRIRSDPRAPLSFGLSSRRRRQRGRRICGTRGSDRRLRCDLGTADARRILRRRGRQLTPLRSPIATQRRRGAPSRTDDRTVDRDPARSHLSGTRERRRARRAERRLGGARVYSRRERRSRVLAFAGLRRTGDHFRILRARGR